MALKIKEKLLRVFIFAFVAFVVTTLLGCQNNFKLEANKITKTYNYSEIKELFDDHRVVSAYLTNENILKLEILTENEAGTGWVENIDGSPKRTHLEYRMVARAEVLEDVFLMMKEADNYNKALPDNDPKKLDFSFNFQVEEYSRH